MPLPDETRDAVNDYVLKHVVPKNIRPRPPTAMQWFMDQFNFVADNSLQKHLAEAYYQARFAGRVREALDLRGGFNHLFIKSQILLYASIFEALIDYFLETNKNHHLVSPMLEERSLRRVAGVFSSSAKITYTDASGTFPIVPCREIVRTRKLKEIQFADRMKTAVSLGLIPSKDAPYIERLYTSRNSIHLIASAARNFKPDSDQSSEAFRILFDILKHLRIWAPPP